jgi:peptidyl-prolyl cis-trans isomerase SurA
MKRIFLYLISAFLLHAPLQAAWAQETIDRVVAVVNKRVITQTDWDEQERFEALVNGRTPESVEFSAASLERLVDLQLMREQIDNVKIEPLTAEQVAAQVGAVRKQIAPAASEQEWKALLTRYSLTEDEFANRVRAQVEVMRFVDLRFRPSVHVENDSVEKYYQQSLVPELMKAGSTESTLPALKDVEPKIRGILQEEKLNEMLKMWLTSLRSQGRIKRMLAETKPVAPAGAN